MLIKLLKNTLLLFAGLTLLYFGTAFTLVLFPINTESLQTADDSITAYVASNGIHIDIILPVSSDLIDWRQSFPLSDLKSPPVDATHIAIGWGDRDFYLNTPQWKNVTIHRALSALLSQHSTLLHVTYLREKDLRNHYAYSLNHTQYASLASYILASADTQNGTPEVLLNSGYGNTDIFYKAQGSYSLFQTCNTWTGTALRTAGVKMSYWTPFDFLVTWHLRKADMTR